MTAPSSSLPEDLVAAVTGLVGDARARRDAPLGPLTTYRVGGPAGLLVELDDPAELSELAALVAPGPRVPVLVVGRGSNLLVADRGFPGLVVTLGAGFAAHRMEGSRVVAGAALRLPVLARATVAAGLTGFEWAVGVPGSLGGAVRMNAGGHGSDMSACLLRARVVSLAGGDDTWWGPDRLALGYRRSAVGPADVVVEAELGLTPGDRARGEALLDGIVAWRRLHQPGGRNAGSVFTNPPGDSAGRLVEAAGLKGRRVGGAVVSPKHANFVVCDEGARASDVVGIMALVRAEVSRRFGVDLVPETRLVGFTDDELHPVGLGSAARPGSREVLP